MQRGRGADRARGAGDALGSRSTSPTDSHDARPSRARPAILIGNCRMQVDSSKLTAMETEDELLRVEEFGTQPRRLDPTRPLRVLVARPKKSRTKAEKEQEVEVLQINGIRVDPRSATRFDVYIAAPRGDLAGPGLGEFAGIFLKLPYKREDSVVVRTAGLKLGLTSLLDDMNADDAEKLVVSLVLRAGDVTVGDISIDLRKTDMARDM